MICEKCETCGYFGDTMNHRCPPKFSVYGEAEGPDEAVDVYAYSASVAVEKWAEDNDPDMFECSIVSGGDELVFVSRDGGPASMFIVSGF